MKSERSIPDILNEAAPNEPVSFTFTLERGLPAGKRFQAVMRICPIPTCACEFVEFTCKENALTGELDHSPCRFAIDISTRTVGTKSEGDVRASRRLGNALVAELTSADWEALERFFRASKLSCIETSDDTAAFEALLETDIGSENTMLAFTEVFPWADQPEFKRDGDAWFIADYYCLAPDCPCTGVQLSFIRIVAGLINPQGPSRFGGRLYFDYDTGEASLVEPESGNPRPETLLEDLRVACPDLAQRLQKRHQRLKPLGKRLYSKDPQGDGKPSLPASTTVRVPERVGRNAPCPCGSGKKFKKCCGT